MGINLNESSENGRTNANMVESSETLTRSARFAVEYGLVKEAARNVFVADVLFGSIDEAVRGFDSMPLFFAIGSAAVYWASSRLQHHAEQKPAGPAAEIFEKEP